MELYCQGARAKKSKVIDFGSWKDKTEWPLPYLKKVLEIKIFWIFLMDSYRSMITRNWDFVFKSFRSLGLKESWKLCHRGLRF